MQQSPQLRYLLRVVVLLILCLTVWWLSLDATLGVLRLSTELALRVMFPFSTAAQVTIAPSGDWHFRVPVPAAIGQRDEIQQIFGRKSKADPPVKVRSLQLDIVARHVVLFTVSLPFFWAMTLAAPWTRRLWKALLIGTLALGLVATLSTVFDVVFTFSNQTHLALSKLVSSLFDAINYLSLNVIPYLAPLIAAVALCQSLRAIIFTFQLEPAPAAPRGAPPPKSIRKKPARVGK